jgi:hypothetical protein
LRARRTYALGLLALTATATPQPKPIVDGDDRSGRTSEKYSDKPMIASATITTLRSHCGAQQISAIATVTAVDQKKSTITRKGPGGNVVTLNVQNPDQFKVVMKNMNGEPVLPTEPAFDEGDNP